ncbi:MAG: tryptophan synthase subunit alpha, partial [Pseudomonadota bacterium]|nr:tryptophan synthase subunit alpha [Pseudomonadota bacterium]
TDAEVAGVDGLIIVDLPPEETELTKLLIRSSIDFIYLVAPTTNEDRLAKIIKHAGGFLYYVSVTGITGTRAPNSEHVRQAVKRLQKHTDLPIAVGFGIREPEQAAEIGRWADFVVVGSALVSRIGENIKEDGTTKSSCKQSVLTLVSALSEAISSNKSTD